MSTLAEVKLWGKTIGAVFLKYGQTTASFEYDGAFLQSDIQISPIMMPLSRRVYQFPELSNQTFYGLPGLLADSLPDKFGNTVIDAWLASQGRQPGSFNAIERLCYVGIRGMGALEFSPVIGPKPKQSHPLEVSELVSIASDILIQKHQFRTALSAGAPDALRNILHVGTPAGGARAKAVIAWHPQTNEVRSGQVNAGDGFECWLLKFDGVSGNKDKELEDPNGFGLIEYAYYLMARDCGIHMSDCRLFRENGRSHFMTRRFDRNSATGQKVHMQSLGALAHYDFNMADAHSYEQAFMVMRQLEQPMQEIEQQFRRMAFNIIARNQDDHVKNIAFLMNRSGEWSLAPAFDVTYSFNPNGAWTARHQMAMNGKRADFDMDDFNACAKTASMKRGRARTIVNEVQQTVSNWRLYAEKAGVPEKIIDPIQAALNLKPYT